MIEKKKYAVDETVKRFCSGCDSEQDHVVLTATKQGQITKLQCTICETMSSYKSGVKTAVEMLSSKAHNPYDRNRKYKKGQAMLHSTFGLGEVLELIEPQKIDVLFGDRVRRLIHAQV
jgi:hypothetical protein